MRHVSKSFLIPVCSLIIAGACTTEASKTTGESTDLSQGDDKADGTGASLHVTLRPVGLQLGANCERDHYDVRVSYKDQSLPWGTRVSVHRGISGFDNDGDRPNGGDTFAWWWPRDEAASPTSGWTWANTETLTRGIEIADGLVHETYDFVIHIEYPDGGDVWDNGGSNYGFYRVSLEGFPSDCSGNAAFSARSIERVIQ